MQTDSQSDSKTSTPATSELQDADNASTQRSASALPLPKKGQALETNPKVPSVPLPSLGEGAEAAVGDATNRVKTRRRKGRATDEHSVSAVPSVPMAEKATTGRTAPNGEHLTARDGAIGAAHAAQLMQVGGPLAHTAVQAVGIADALKVASDVTQGREVSALDVASASASVVMTTGTGGPAVQGAAAVSAVDAGRRALTTLEDKAASSAEAAQSSAAPASPTSHQREPELPTAIANSIEHVSARELQPESRDTAELRRALLAERSSAGGSETPSSSPSPSRTAGSAASAAAAESSSEKEDRDRETIARMTRPELDEYAAARNVSEERVDQVLRAAQRRIEAEADRPGVRAYPPLEERFNIKRHLLRRDYEFRDQPGKVAFTERWLSMKSTAHSAAVVKAMVDRAEERGWTAVRVEGSAEFERQVWIAATARGIKALGYEPTEGDRLAMAQERERLNAERGRAHAQDGGTTPARADLSGGQSREATGEIPRDAARPPGFARRVSVQSNRTESTPREPAIVRALRPLLVERGDSAEDIAAIVAVAAERLPHDRVYVGKVVGHGEAPYQFDEKNASSYFLKLATPSGEKTVWSVDLKRVLDESNIKVGDNIALEHRGVTPVSVGVADRDPAGRVVGQHDEVVKRNTWYAVNVEQLRVEAFDRSASVRRSGVDPALADEATAKALAAKPTQAVEQERQTEPRSHARDALVLEALEAAFTAKNVPAELRDNLRKDVQKELDLRSARGEAVEVSVFDPGAPRQLARTVRVPQRQHEPHDRAR